MKQKEFKLTPGEYSEFLEEFYLETIYLDECSIKRRDEFIKDEMVYLTDDTFSHIFENKNNVSIYHKFTFWVTEKRKADYAIKIICTFIAKFSSEN